MTTTSTQSQRFCVRLPCELPAEITFSGGGLEHVKKAVISNISTTGIQILSPSFIATGQMVQASFKVPGKSSKTTLKAEVMRIESLQGRTVHRYPYALGAKFVTPEKNQEDQITQFISKKVTCASWRLIAVALFLFLSAVQLGRTLLHTVFSSSYFAELDWQGISRLGSVNWLFDPAISAVASAGLFSAAIFCAWNRRFFMRWGFFWSATSLLLSAAHLYAEWEISPGTQNSFVESADALILICSTGLILILVQIELKLRQMEKMLSTQRIAPSLNRPTFTIL